MAIAEEIIGTHYRYHDRFVVGREKIREFAAALKDDHPAHRDEAEANELGYDGVLAPLTFIAVAGRRVQLEMFKRFDVGINIARVIHRDQKITFHRPLVAGDELYFDSYLDGVIESHGAVIAEILRAGITALPRGQSEAAASLGLRWGQTMRSILLPQAITSMLPVLISQLVVVLKDTAIGYQITFVEMVRQGTVVGSSYGNYIPALIVIAIIMILINFGLSSLATYLEKRLRTGRRKVTVPDADDADIAASENLPTFGTK